MTQFLENENSTGQPMPPHDHEDPREIERFEAMEEIGSRANYRENWSNLFYKRLLHPKTIENYLRNLGPKYTYLIDEDGYKRLAAEYVERVKSVFSHTKIGKAEEYSNSNFQRDPRTGGLGMFRENPIVYSDATQQNGEPFDDFHKSVAEAHEQCHGVLDDPFIEEGLRNSIIDLFNKEYIAEYVEYNAAAYEIRARISQLKNYFGMSGDEQFTRYHLDYAKDHYVKDVGEGIDNMSNMLYSIKSGKENAFILLANSIPC
jgi:hypothetical protein